MVGASFLGGARTPNMVFLATAMSPPTLSTLVSQLPANESILSAWNFSTTDYAVSSTNPIYLSFNVGAGQSSDDLNLWQYNGTTWTPYVPTDLTYDGTFASFTATGLSGYAMTAVPEPSTLALLGIAAIGLLACAWRRRKLHRLRLADFDGGGGLGCRFGTGRRVRHGRHARPSDGNVDRTGEP